MSQFSICFVSLLAALAGFHPNLAAKSPKETAAPGVQMTIRVYDYVRLSAAEYEPARRHADRIFARAGIDTRWLNCALTPNEPSDPGCKKAITPTDLVLRILPEDMAARVRVSGKVFGYAVPSGDDGFGTVASIFHHRVAELIAEKRQRVGGRLYSNAVVLGHILAHEMGHLMLGRNSHSRSGIMAFPWGPKQLNGCLSGGLLFSKSEAAMIRREARKRQQARQIRTSAQERIEAANSHRIIDAPLKLTVNIYNYAQASESILSVATVEAARILRDAGIETGWALCATEPELIRQYPDCTLPGRASLVMRIIPRSMARPKPSGPAAFGVALVPKDGSFGVFASVYIEAVAAIAGNDEALGARILGHLMSHELGHLLLGKQSHSRRGIMRADWLEKDLQDAGHGRLLFTTQQASNMRSAVLRRSSAWNLSPGHGPAHRAAAR